MTPKQLATLLRRQLDAKGVTVSQFHADLSKRYPMSRQTVYNAINGRPIKTDTLLAILAALELEIVEAK